jgi:CBS domain-containing protein
MSSHLTNITVNEIMSLVPYSISPENSVYHAYGLMYRKRFGGLPVIENGVLVGVITRTDIKKNDSHNMREIKIKDIMSNKPITVYQTEKVSVALEKLTNCRIGGMPVLSDSNSLVGWISLSDIERAARTLRNKKINAVQTINCPNCTAPLPSAIYRTVTCQHCGHMLSI